MLKTKLKIDVKTNWGIMPKGSEVVILDDNTPLQQAYRVQPADAVGVQVFGIKKAYAYSTFEQVPE